MLVDKVKKYYEATYDLNCAEAVIYAANEEYDLNLSKEVLKTMSAFGGGMGVESVCGAMTGALAVLGIMFTVDRAHENTKIRELAQEFFRRFMRKLGTDNCLELKGKYRNDEDRCSLMVYTAADILQELVEENKDIRVK